MTTIPFIEGLMPLQFFMELAGIVLVFSGVTVLLDRAGLRINRFTKAIVVFGTIFLYLKYRVYPPLPFSILTTYLVVALTAILMWASSSEVYWQEFRRPILAILDANTVVTRMSRAICFVILPFLAWFIAWNSMLIKIVEPIELRTVGPAPPRSFQLHGKEITLDKVTNPFRVNPQGQYDHGYTSGQTVENSPGHLMRPTADPWHSKEEPYLAAVLEGGKIYFQECVFCHGANLDGRGIFAGALVPFPTNFTDPGTIAQRQETYILWRTATGGISLPPEGFPWISTMPKMEEHLSTNDIWKVVMFEYWHTGWISRTWD